MHDIEVQLRTIRELRALGATHVMFSANAIESVQFAEPRPEQAPPAKQPEQSQDDYTREIVRAALASSE